MSNEKTPNTISKKSTLIRIAINLAIIAIGLTAVVMFMSYMQHEYSALKANKTSAAALETIIETLDSNTEMVRTLHRRYHEDNRAVLNDMCTLLMSDRYEKLERITQEERCATMQRLSRAIGENGYLFVTRGDGTIVMAPDANSLYDNLVANGALEPEELDFVLHSTDEDYADRTVIGTPAGTDTDFYFYGCNLRDDYYLVYAVESAELEIQFRALKELSPILSSVVVGNDGFVFAVDSSTGLFEYFDDGNVRLDGTSYAEAGLEPAALEDNFSGRQTINGVSYQCLSRTYSSPLYGRYTVITAVCPADTIFSRDMTAITVTAACFILCSGVIVFYASLLQQDPEQMAHYDENVLSGKEAYRRRHKAPLNSIHNIQIYRVRGNLVYLKTGIAARLAPIVVISSLLVFAISWNSQTLVGISGGISLSSTTLQQLDNLFGTRESSAQIIMDRYENQYMSKVQLISFMLEDNPTLIKSLNYLGEADGVHTHLTDDLEPVINEYGRPVRSMANSAILKELAENNKLDYLGVYDDHGRTLAVNEDTWYFVISSDDDRQSAPFMDIITGRRDNYIQTAGEDEFGKTRQYIGAVFYYYTLDGDGPDAGLYVSAEDYENYLKEGSYEKDGAEYSITLHRGMVQGGIADETILAIMESTSNGALMRQVRAGADGFTVLFDNSSEHVCVWSPRESSVNRTAEELNVSGAAFSGTFKGFNRVNGVNYFQMYVFANNYWIATAIPTDSLFAGCMPVSLITAGVSTVFFLVIFLLCIFSTEQEEQLLESSLENRINRGGDNGMVKVQMPSGKIKYVRSASARYAGNAVLWADMTTDQRLNVVLRAAVSIVVAIILLAVIFCDDIFGTDSAISYIVHGDWEHGLNYFALVAFAVTILSISVIASLVSGVINFIIQNMGARVETVGKLMLSVIKYGAVLFSIFYGLSMLGISTAGLVTSASIMSIVIGLGAQSLIGDILSGIFIVFEGAFRVGDIVTVGDFRGSVVDIGLRTTKIENTAGDIKIFNNSSIAGIINMTKKASKALCDIGIEYGADLPAIEKLLKEALPKIGAANPQIISDPVYLGVAELGSSAVTLRIVADCAEKDRLAVARYLNRALFLLFRENEVNIPFPQVTLSYLEPEEKPDTGDKTES